MDDYRLRFQDSDLAVAQALFPGDDIELHDGALVISRPPDRVACRVTEAIARSLRDYFVQAPTMRFEERSPIKFDSFNVRRFSLALWEAAFAVPSLVVLVLSAEDRLRWGRGKVNRALELGVRRALLVAPIEREVTAFEGVERIALTESIGYDHLPGWFLSTSLLFAQAADAENKPSSPSTP